MQPGYGAEDLGLYMRRRQRCQELRQEYEAGNEKLVLYSARHSYAHRATYSKWCGDDGVDDAVEKAASRLRKT